MPIEVREATPEEYDETGRVTAEAYREFVGPGDDDWVRYVDHIADVSDRAQRAIVLVAVEAGRILGSVTLEIEDRIEPDGDPPLRPHEASIRMLGVDPAARGRGIARLLMAECESRARAAGRTLVTLHTTRRMKAAQRLYESLGYERGEDRVFPDGFVLLSYSASLA
ncbi:MAG: GNAT family N-acetyltransferase [Actinomycetota bacterium]|nr:GNAT family N-acetyltransferase [Actinomycetota bacterium]